MIKETVHLKPQDIVILCKIICLTDSNWNQSLLADQLGISRAEVSYSLERSKKANLIDSTKRIPHKEALIEFLVHGIKYAFPSSPGGVVRGIPTAHSAPPLSKLLKGHQNDKLVWAHPTGSTRGQAVVPLFPSVPSASQSDKKFHELLALVDGLRIGRAREQSLAEQELKKRILK